MKTINLNNSITVSGTLNVVSETDPGDTDGPGNTNCSIVIQDCPMSVSRIELEEGVPFQIEAFDVRMK